MTPLSFSLLSEVKFLICRITQICFSWKFADAWVSLSKLCMYVCAYVCVYLIIPLERYLKEKYYESMNIVMRLCRESSRDLKSKCSLIILSSRTTGSKSNNVMCWRQTKREKETEIVLASLRDFACVPESDMTDGLSRIAPLTVHVPISVWYFQPSILSKNAQVSGLIVLKGMYQYFGCWFIHFSLLFSFSAYQFVNVLLQV